MFPLNEQNEVQIFEELSPFVPEEDNNLLEELLGQHAAEVVQQEGKNGNCNNNELELKKLGDDDDKGSSSKLASKKTMHREIESQRRQQMAVLYASLRSLLPLEYIKGKRAISDHMNEAVKYIKDMQKEIEEMKMQRDKLSNLSLVQVKNSTTTTINDPSEKRSSNISSSDSLNNYVKVNHLRPNELEILIRSSTAGQISKVLFEMHQIRGFNVVNCVSTRTNNQRCFLHKIHIEVNDLTCVDLSKIQERLTNVINRLA